MINKSYIWFLGSYFRGNYDIKTVWTCSDHRLRSSGRRYLGVVWLSESLLSGLLSSCKCLIISTVVWEYRAVFSLEPKSPRRHFRFWQAHRTLKHKGNRKMAKSPFLFLFFFSRSVQHLYHNLIYLWLFFSYCFNNTKYCIFNK